MDRRDFLKISAAGIFTVGLIPGSDLLAADRKRRSKKAGESYSVVILGDTHFDAAPDSVYHEGYSDPDPVREANHRKEFARNAEMWTTRCPRLLKRATCLVDDDTRMVMQTGDLIQGDTAGVENHVRMLSDAFNMLKSAFGTLPLITVAGNHDVRGLKDAEAREAYLQFMPAQMGRELGTSVEDNNFSFRIGQDAYIVVDFNKPDDDKVASLLAECADARWTFILCHAPVFPYDSDKYYKWYYHGKDKDYTARDRMLKLFARQNVIVLCGHSHTTEIMDWECSDGRISQMTMNSVWKSEKVGTYEVSAEGAAEYGILRKKNPEVFNEFRDGIRKYSRSNAAGSYKLCVSDEGVYVDFYAGDSSQRSERFILR